MSDPDDLDDVVREFLVESHENLDQLDRDLVALEKDPQARERLASVFRTIHTIKGTCGFLGFGKLESVAHVGESLLSRLRDGELVLTAEITTGLLSTVDAVREMLASVEAAGNDGDGDYGALVERLTQLQQGGPEPSPAPVVDDVAALVRTQAAEVDAVWAEALDQAATATRPAPAVADAGGDRPGVSDTTIRVDVGLLDKLMNLVGELVLARNQVLQFAATQGDAAFVATSQRLNLITTELQDGVMKTRMQPIGTLWGKLPRVVRDLAIACGKAVRVEMEGQETELDKTIIEAIKDPLTHVVRNAVDHGTEPAATRAAAGKPREGRLVLRAFHQGGRVNIEISDDGRGLDHERIREKAIQRGLITAEQGARMTDRAIMNLIFLPGFSTAPTVTNVSGRGVGMDVVKTNIERIGGTVDVLSRPGQGTTLRIRIPLTLAIIPALIVTSGGDRYAIPQVSLKELVLLEGQQARRGIEMIHGAPVYRLRGELLPLVFLNRELLGDGRTPADGDNVVVLLVGHRQFGLVVDSVDATQEIVVKPLGKQLQGISAFAGATIMGDGTVALILDVLGIAQRARVVAERRDGTTHDARRVASDAAEARQTLLLLGTAQGGRMALPLSTVARLEVFPRHLLERVAGQDVIQYRGQILGLIRLSTALAGVADETATPAESLHVVVYREGDRRVGIMVDRILDIVEDTVTITHHSNRPGVLGSAIIQQRVTEMLDVPGIIREAAPA